ncbi:hypothetical protein [Spirosoma sp.]|uniref:hypothetical protein n=1 Tax=Spirosoma sp. TaxID=1899569 RepID=UPI003B3A49EC
MFLLSLVWATTACQQQDVNPLSPQPSAANPISATSSSARLGIDIDRTQPIQVQPIQILPFGTVNYSGEGTSAMQFPTPTRGVIVLYSKYINKQLPWSNSGKIVKRVVAYRKSLEQMNYYFHLTSFTGEYNGPQQPEVTPDRNQLNAGNSWYLKVLPGQHAFYYRYYDANNELISVGQFHNRDVKPMQFAYIGD